METELLQFLEKQNAVMDKISQRLDSNLEKTVSTSNNANLLHGSTGLFGTPGLERDVITAHVRPYGISATLPFLASTTEDPRFPSITGFGDVSGSQPATVCADAPVGYMKGANLTAKFGLKRFDTNTIDIGKVIARKNRGDFTDLVLRGRLLGDNVGTNLTEDGILNIVTKSEMVIVGVSFERALNQDYWQGTVAGGTFPGLDVQVATGHMDADTATLAPSLDSLVMDFGSSAVDSATKDIVEYVSSMEYNLQRRALDMGLNPASWKFYMRPDLWFELSAIWPCRYMTNRCTTSGGTNTVTINDGSGVQVRDDMRNGMYIWVNGNKYDVVTDTGIYEKNSTNSAGLAKGEYASSIYMLPQSIVGNFPVLYVEYLDFRDGLAMQNESILRGMNEFWTDNGIYSWAVEQNKWCYKIGGRTEQRIVLRTPHLAGKLQNVKYTPLQHLRDSDPKSPYWADGGVSMRSSTGGSAVWNSIR